MPRFSSPAAIVPPRPAWRSLLWMVPFTVLWTWMIYAVPVLPESGLPALAVRLMVHGLIALGLWLGLESTDLTPGQRRTTWLARISHGFKRIGAPNQRKLFCENDLLVIRGEPRCRQSVPRIFLDLKPSKAAR